MSGPIFTYPKDLAIHGRAICISPLAVSVKDRFSDGKPERIGYIFLPIPNGLRTAYNADWSREKLGVLGGEALTQIRNGNLDLGSLAGAAGAKVMQNLGSMASEYIGVDVNALASYASRGIMNPNYALVFNGSNFRSFNFAYRLVARNRGESDQIREIVSILKSCMSPGVGSESTTNVLKGFTKDVSKATGINSLESNAEYANKAIDSIASHFLEFPNLFRIDFLTNTGAIKFAQTGANDSVIDNSHRSDRNKYLFQPGICALEKLDVDYGTEGGTPAFFKESGAPVTVSISLSFLETEIVTKESIRKGGPS